MRAGGRPVLLGACSTQPALIQGFDNASGSRRSQGKSARYQAEEVDLLMTRYSVRQCVA
tara:strand:+ start:29518 stop:29694 length:177 start_codon:yes stop_codon:yes gene_type:complete